MDLPNRNAKEGLLKSLGDLFQNEQNFADSYRFLSEFKTILRFNGRGFYEILFVVK